MQVKTIQYWAKEVAFRLSMIGVPYANYVWLMLQGIETVKSAD